MKKVLLLPTIQDSISPVTLEYAPEWIVRSGITYNYKFISTTLQGNYVSEIYMIEIKTANESIENSIQVK